MSLINTLNSITSVNLDTFSPEPSIDGKGSHGGYAGQAVKPIGLHMVAEIARDADTASLPISGIGGSTTWRGRRGVHRARLRQRAGVHGRHGLRLPHRRGDGRRAAALDGGQGLRAPLRLPGARGQERHRLAAPHLNYTAKARIDQEVCIKCGRCYAACEDTSHQSIAVRDGRVFEVIDEECVACNLCVITCPWRTASRWSRCRSGRWTRAPARSSSATRTGRRTRTTRARKTAEPPVS